MVDAQRITLPKRTDPFVRTVVTAWRSLTGGTAVRDAHRRTLVACSGGADSSALLLALATVNPGPEVCHVIHGMRSEAESAGDATRTAGLCEMLGVRCHVVRVNPSAEAGNLEANARTARYRVLAEVAQARGLGFVVTGHHADDQLETVLMRLIRGAGVRGMAGIRSSRELSKNGRLVRPMLGVTHDQAADLCSRCGWCWNEDATNSDRTRMRAALRASVLPALRSVDPHAAEKAARTAAAMASADDAICVWAERVLEGASQAGEGCVQFELEKLVVLPRSVLVSLIGMVYTRIVGASGRDRLSQRVLDTCIGGIVGNNRARQLYNLAEMSVCIEGGSVEFYKK